MVEWPDYKDVPMQWFVCDVCDGYGYEGRTVTVYEHGCAWPHKDTEEWPCSQCGGDGGWIGEAETNSAYDPTSQPYDEPLRHNDAARQASNLQLHGHAEGPKYAPAHKVR